MRPRLPAWLRKPETDFVALHQIKRELRRRSLHTVCEAARCPNIHECFHRGTATFMILGDRCTRGCGFCAVAKARHPPPPDPCEPARVAEMARQMGLRHVVVTSVNRDDLPDGGAAHFAATIAEIRKALPGATVEVLTPDFRGDLDAVETVLAAGPDVFNHNVETVPRLYPRVRPQARYERSLAVLAFAGRRPRAPLVKSGLMVGLGETPEEVRAVMRDLRQAGVAILTVGQYLQPTLRNLPVVEYVPPERFEEYRRSGLELGFRAVFSGPFVRSSYMAERLVRRLGEVGP
ncbi:MAG: lipoyl synthase [Bryobacterales bacterium]|nr:lipoyl synthase [Bryobacteraceae bacterium]MDW8130355.1 lipoyl synthase [Bryobacterales bacterium]